MREELRFVLAMIGTLCVTTHGTAVMPMLCVDN